MDSAIDADELPRAKVLLVDDQPANLLALEAVLAAPGRDLVRAASGEEALRLLLRDDFAAILLDIQMQGLDGFETAQLVRSRERSRHTPILFITAYDSTAFPVVRAYELGAVDYLVKPLVPEILRAKVAVFVDLFHKAERLRRLERREFERRLEEEALRRSEARFRALTEKAWDAVAVLSAAGEVRYCTPSVRHVLGYEPEEIRGQNGAGLVHPDDRGAVVGRLRRLLAEPGGSGSVVFRGRRKDGAWTWLEGAATNLLDDPTVQGLVCNFRDVSDRVAAEEALRQDSRRKDEFLAMLGHELRNPLAPIRNALHVLRLRCGGDPLVRELGGMMERQTAHLTRLVDDLLDLSRITRGRVELRTERVDLRAAAGRALEAAAPLMAERGHRVEADLPDRPLWLEADPTRLEQVLANLLNNAAKYTPPGGRVRLAAAREGGEAVVRVADDGIGVRAGDLPHLFDLFRQADRVPGRVAEGLGVGLSLVRGLVEQHGGRVEAHSDGPGRGSTFVVRLPAADGGTEAEEADRPRPAAAAGGRARPQRVLVVDDNVDAAESLAAPLRAGGHEARTAYDGPAALEAARAFRPRAVFLDIGLPQGMDGHEVARRLRREPGFEGALLVAVTGFGQEQDRVRSFEAGFDAHLVKPADLDALHGLLARLDGG